MLSDGLEVVSYVEVCVVEVEGRRKIPLKRFLTVLPLSYLGELDDF